MALASGESLEHLPPQVRAAIQMESGHDFHGGPTGGGGGGHSGRRKTKSSDPRELQRIREAAGLGPPGSAGPVAGRVGGGGRGAATRAGTFGPSGGGPIRTDMTFAREQFCSVAKEVFEALAFVRCAEAPLSDARFVALSSSNNKAYLEPPFGQPVTRLHPSATVMYLSGEHMLKDRFLCARYVASGSAFQSRIVSHTAPGPLPGMFVERPATGPLGRGCRVLSSPVSWYAPGRVLQEVPAEPYLHNGKLVVVCTCCLVRGDGAVFLASTGTAMLLDARKMAGEQPEIVNLSDLRLETRILVPSLSDLLLRFFSKPYAAQPLASRQVRLFRVDGWLCSDGRVHSIELHTKGFDQLDSKADGVPAPVVEMATAMVDQRAAERMRVASLTVVNADSVSGEAEDVNAHIVRLMTAGDGDDPYVPSSSPLGGHGALGAVTSSAAEVASGQGAPPRSRSRRGTSGGGRASGRGSHSHGRKSTRRGGRYAEEEPSRSSGSESCSVSSLSSGEYDAYDDDDEGGKGRDYGGDTSGDVASARRGRYDAAGARGKGSGRGSDAARAKGTSSRRLRDSKHRSSVASSAGSSRRSDDATPARRPPRSEVSPDRAAVPGARRTLRTLRVSSRT